MATPEPVQPAPAAGDDDSAASERTRQVLVADDGAIRTITLDRPRRRNALDRSMVDELMSAFESVARDKAIGAVVLSGTAPVFCAGSDVAELASLPASERADNQAFWPALEQTISECRVPVVCAIVGGAWGGGLFLASFADLRIAAEDARFAAPEVSLGWLPPGGIEALVDNVGVGVAADIVLTGRTIHGPEALRLGMIDRLVPPDAVVPTAMSLAGELAASPPAGISSARHYFRTRRHLDRSSRDRLALERFASDVATDDAERALARFLPG